jgi:putative Holliday junction resolvase
MIEGGVKKKDRQDKSMVDKISAAIILQSFLDTRLNKKENIELK